MLIPIGDLPLALQLLVVLILDSDRTTDVVDDVLIGRGVVAAGRFVADAVGRFPICVDVTTGHRRTGLGVFLISLEELAATGAGGGCGTIQIERRRRRRHTLVVGDRSALAIEA